MKAGAVLGVLVAAGAALAQPAPDWTEPFPPFRIADNLYYVGSRGLASYLVATPAGHVLINSNLSSSVPLLRASVEQLGFEFADIKILLISHAHFDHCGGSAEILEATGAKYMVMEGDVPVVESGGRNDFQYGGDPDSFYPPAKVDRVLHDGDRVAIGDTTLVARLTAGHTKGCTTWTMRVQEGGKTLDAVIVGSPNVNPGYRLADNAKYPEIARDYRRGFDLLKSLPCDLFLGAHGSYFDLEEKRARAKDAAASPFVDRRGYRAFVAQKENEFRSQLERQRATAGVK